MHLKSIISLPLSLLLSPLPQTAAQLNKYAQAAGLKYFGTAVDNPSLGDATYMSVVRDPDEFGALTPANGQKWQLTEPSQGQFSYGSGDAIAGIVRGSGQLLRCHTLVWHRQLPGWVSGVYARDQMQRILSAHIENVAGHYKGQCYAWDVVNEVVEDDGTFRQSPMYRAMGADYIAHAFKVAEAADPAAKLYINDFNIERCCNDKIRAIHKLVGEAKAAGARIDGIGMQDHARVGKAQSKKELMDTMALFSEVVDELAYTEVDIRQTDMRNVDREQQAVDYVALVEACLETEKCIGISVWDFTDKYSWVPNEFPGEGEACLWDGNYNKKPAYSSILSVFQSAAAAKTASVAEPTTLSTVVSAEATPTP